MLRKGTVEQRTETTSNGIGAHDGDLHGNGTAMRSPDSPGPATAWQRKVRQRSGKARHGTAEARKIMETPDNAQLTALIIKSIHKKEKNTE